MALRGRLPLESLAGALLLTSLLLLLTSFANGVGASATPRSVAGIVTGNPVNVTFSLSPSPAAGTVALTEGSTVVFITKNTSLTLEAGATYPIVAQPAKGFQFVDWVPNGELTVQNPSAEETNLTVESGEGLTAQFAVVSSSPSGLDLFAWPGELLWPGLAVLVVAAAVLFLRRRPPVGPTGSAAATSQAPPVSSSPPASTVELASWTRRPLTVWEGVKETDLWPRVKETVREPSQLLAITGGPSERIASRYGLEGASVVRISRVDAAAGGEEVVRPSDLDRLADRIEKHLSAGERRVVVLPDVEALLAASGTKNVNRLLEVCRDVALYHKGSILFTVDPLAVAPADLALIERNARKVEPPS